LKEKYARIGVYILTNKRDGTLYIGVTNDLVRRIYEHKNDLVEGFSSKYKLHTLVYYEHHHTIESAIKREKRLKHYLREWKINLINEKNPDWCDLYQEICQ
jgi:putative endonuclease